MHHLCVQLHKTIQVLCAEIECRFTCLCRPCRCSGWPPVGCPSFPCPEPRVCQAQRVPNVRSGAAVQRQDRSLGTRAGERGGPTPRTPSRAVRRQFIIVSGPVLANYLSSRLAGLTLRWQPGKNDTVISPRVSLDLSVDTVP